MAYNLMAYDFEFIHFWALPRFENFQVVSRTVEDEPREA